MGKRTGIKLAVFAVLAAFVMVMPQGMAVHAAQPVEMILATATTGGTYYPVGVALSTLWSIKLRKEKPAPIKVNPITSAGSGENINMLKGNEVEISHY